MVDERRDRLADVRAVEAVTRALREPGDDGALDLFLQVEDDVVALAAERATECGHVAPRRLREGFMPPAAQRERHDASDPRVQAHQVDKGVFGDPIDGKPGTVAHDIGHEGHRIHDIAERAGPHDENAAHAARRGKT